MHHRPANGEFTVELAANRAYTTLSHQGKKVGLYGDGQDHPNLGGPTDGKATPTSCITNPNRVFYGFRFFVLQS